MAEGNSIPLPPPASSALLSLEGRGASNNASIPTMANPFPVPSSGLFANPAIQPSSVINLSNSSDVVIGPMTQYQGPVTIYQYMDATVEARATHAGGGVNQNRTNQESHIIRTSVSNNKSLIFTLILILTIVIAGVTVYFLVTKNQNTQQSREILFSNNYESGTFPNIGNGHLVVDRDQWGASDRGTANIPLKHPIPYVLITHVGVQATPCFSVYKCSIKMRTYQDSAIAEKGLPDINSNFYVGNDGNIYVGRGWHISNTYANKTLALTFMGDYLRHDPEPRQLEAVEYLLAYGITNKYLALDYKLVAQNQTKKTHSPGTSVYKSIVKWPHWYPCSYEDNPKCGAEVGLPEIWDGKQ